MLVNRILLQDNIDKNFSDLIMFDYDIHIEEIIDVIEQVKNKLPYDYTFDDIIGAIHKNFKVVLEIDLYNTFIVEY